MFIKSGQVNLAISHRNALVGLVGDALHHGQSLRNLVIPVDRARPMLLMRFSFTHPGHIVVIFEVSRRNRLPQPVVRVSIPFHEVCISENTSSL